MASTGGRCRLHVNRRGGGHGDSGQGGSVRRGGNGGGGAHIDVPRSHPLREVSAHQLGDKVGQTPFLLRPWSARNRRSARSRSGVKET